MWISPSMFVVKLVCLERTRESFLYRSWLFSSRLLRTSLGSLREISSTWQVHQNSNGKSEKIPESPGVYWEPEIRRCSSGLSELRQELDERRTESDDSALETTQTNSARNRTRTVAWIVDQSLHESSRWIARLSWLCHKGRSRTLLFILHAVFLCSSNIPKNIFNRRSTTQFLNYFSRNTIQQMRRKSAIDWPTRFSRCYKTQW